MFQTLLEKPSDSDEIEALLDREFGAERKETKAVYRLREGVAPVAELCFVMREEGALRACIRAWPVLIDGRARALLVGPIAVEPAERERGIGVSLIKHALAMARAQGHRIAVLVGDEDYYRRFGFRRDLAAGLTLPGLDAPERLLAAELVPGALAGVAGEIDPGDRLRRTLRIGTIRPARLAPRRRGSRGTG
jgi:predicted N-acetyltransferase YhbS